MSRKAEIRSVPVAGSNESGSNGPDKMFIIDLYENNKLVQTRELRGKSQAFANDVVENWNAGLIKLLID